jgi:hypothetical protein
MPIEEAEQARDKKQKGEQYGATKTVKAETKIISASD